MAETCTPQGMRTVLVDRATADEGVQAAVAAMECTYFLLCGHLPVLPFAPLSVLPPVMAEAAMPTLFQHSNRILLARP